MPVGDIKKSIGFYCDKLGFTLVHHEDGFAVLMCNEVRIHLWEASDEGWRSRSNDSPVCTGAESFIAGTASCRIEVEGIDELYQHIKPLGILHPNTSLKDQWWDERDFAGHCCKVSDEAAFCLIQRPYISKTLLTRRISPRGSP